jgi:type IV secretion system protein VirB6
MACAGLPIGADASLSASLASLDCQVNGAVAGGYGRLLSSSGAFGGALTAALSIFVALLALGLITGRTRMSLGALTPKALAFGLVLTFATSWPAYQALIYGLLTGGPDQVAAALMGARSGATHAFAARLDSLFGAVVEAGQAVSALPKAANLATASNLIWASAITLLLSTLGLLVVARVALAVLLALGPLFVVFGLFSGTRGLFHGWLRTSVAFALAPMLIVLGGAGVMAVLGPLIQAVADDPAGAVTELRPIVTLFVASLVYAGLVLTLMWTAVSLTRGWRPRLDGAAADADVAHGASTVTEIAPVTRSPSAAALTGDRVAGVVAAVVSSDSRSSHRIEALTHALPAAQGPSAATPRRAAGLGQSFRAAPERRVLAGSLGS